MIQIVKGVIMILVHQSLGLKLSELQDGTLVKLKNNLTNGENYLGLKVFPEGGQALGLYNASEKMHTFRITRNQKDILIRPTTKTCLGSSNLRSDFVMVSESLCETILTTHQFSIVGPKICLTSNNDQCFNYYWGQKIYILNSSSDNDYNQFFFELADCDSSCDYCTFNGSCICKPNSFLVQPDMKSCFSCNAGQYGHYKQGKNYCEEQGYFDNGEECCSIMVFLKIEEYRIYDRLRARPELMESEYQGYVFHGGKIFVLEIVALACWGTASIIKLGLMIVRIIKSCATKKNTRSEEPNIELPTIVYQNNEYS